MTASSNFGNVFSLLIAAIWLPFVPIKPVQILFLNMLYDFSCLAITLDNMDPEFLVKPQPWSVKSIGYFMVCIGPMSTIFDLTTYAFCYFYLGWDTDEGDNAAKFQTCWFLESLLTQTLIIHITRTQKWPFIERMASWPLTMSNLVACVLGFLMATTEPLTAAFGMIRPPDAFWIYLPICILCYMLLTNAVKFLYIRIVGSWL